MIPRNVIRYTVTNMAYYYIYPHDTIAKPIYKSKTNHF